VHEANAGRDITEHQLAGEVPVGRSRKVTRVLSKHPFFPRNEVRVMKHSFCVAHVVLALLFLSK
jgi:hypothetical protein